MPIRWMTSWSRASFGAFMVFFVTVGETYGIGTMIGVPGAIYSKGVSYSLWFLGYILLGFVVGYFMNPAIWRMGKISGAMTMPDCFRWRYGSKALEVLVAVICIVFLLPWMQMQFAGLATILRYIGWDISYTVGIGISAAIAYLYIAVAGIRAPAWISIMKDILMMAAIVSGGLVAIHNMPGGISGIFDMAIAHFPDKVVIDAEPITKNATFVFSTIIFQALGFCVTPLQYQFIFTAKSEDTIRRNQIIMPLYMFMYPFLIVAAYFVLVTVPNLNDPDSSFMALAAANLPEWTVGMVAAGGALTCILVIAVSALNLGGIFSRNIWGVFRSSVSQKQAVLVTNMATGASLLISVVLAVMLPNLMLGVINIAYFWATQCFPMALATFFWRGATRTGVFAGLLTGVVAVASSRPARDLLGPESGVVAMTERAGRGGGLPVPTRMKRRTKQATPCSPAAQEEPEAADLRAHSFETARALGRNFSEESPFPWLAERFARPFPKAFLRGESCPAAFLPIPPNSPPRPLREEIDAAIRRGQDSFFLTRTWTCTPSRAHPRMSFVFGGNSHAYSIRRGRWSFSIHAD
ncbi:MAG: sodium:solute symporter family protein [Bilophila wadsworthia]